MKSFSRLQVILAAITLMAIACSCGSKKQIASKGYQQENPIGAVNAQAALATQSLPWQKLKVPMTLRLSSPKSLSVSGQATMVYNKSVTISLRFFGMEIGLIHLTADSVIALDKYNKRYVAESLHKFMGGFPVNMANVQSLLIGQPFLLGSTNSPSKEFDKFEADYDNNILTLIPLKQPAGVEYGFSFDSALQLTRLIVKAGSNHPVNIDYRDSRQTKAGAFAEEVSIEATAGKTPVAATIEWKPSKAKWDADVEPRAVTIPSNYQRIDTSKLLKGLKSL